ncbi:MAG: transcription elongation factor [Verrucomicrobia bacterium]|nr:MAG: transcription elongation factor [Verrucomicrobiota bacterium]
MPEQETIERAREDAGEGKSPSTQAGEFVRDEMEHIREGKHGARSPQQAIAIGLSKARRAGVKLPPPKRGSAKIKKQAVRDLRKGKSRRQPSRRRSRAVRKALRRESRRSASQRALSRQARSAARRRSKASRSRAAKKAARTRKRKR